MKVLLNYYYYLYPDKIQKKNNNYYFEFKNHFFCFYLYNGNPEELNAIYNLNNYMILNNYKVNRIIVNKDFSIITKKDNKNYILIELLINERNEINLNNIIEFNKINFNINFLNRTNWLNLWEVKIDNIEYTLQHIKKKYNLLYNSSFYYIGLAENAISYLKYLNLVNTNISICHKRINASDNLIDFYNPINFIIDYKVRDYAEYYKSLFFYKNKNIETVLSSIKSLKLNTIDYIFFYIRLLYPSYYFDLYDKVLNGTKKEEDIKFITNMQNEYEYFLYEVWKFLKEQVNIVGIEWINKKFMN